FVRPEKGIEFLIEAVRQLVARHDVRLVVAGARDKYPDYQAKLDNAVRRHSLHGRIEWVGYCNHQQVRQLMRASDLFAFPSLSEGTPRVLLEARANSLPVVATKVGGVPDSVDDGVDGLLVPPRDSTAMAEALERLILDGALRRRLIGN